MEKGKNVEINFSKGITLISLIVTVIILIILAGVTISLTIGENGIITKAKESARILKMSEYKEKIGLMYLEKGSIEGMIENLEKEKTEGKWINTFSTYDEEGNSHTPINTHTILIVETKEGYELIAKIEDGNMTIKENYEIGIKHTIKYDANEGNGKIDEQTIRDGFYVILSSNKDGFTRQDYEFIGWEDEDGNIYSRRRKIQTRKGCNDVCKMVTKYI